MGFNPAAAREEAFKNNRVRPVIRGPEDPDVDDAICAALFMANMTATWAVNHWVVSVRDSHKYTAQTAGARVRFKTGVRLDAPGAEWLAEINRLWKGLHPNEKLPFGED